MSYIFVLFAFVGFFAKAAHAHMEMQLPFPFKSRFNDQIVHTNESDNMIGPLYGDGSNFPCKKLIDFNTPPTASYVKGASQELIISGTAPHGGGSCQLSISTDGGKTFRVIKSIIGGCPLKQTYDFTIPASVPQGKALFSWTWFNLVGNREMYQNCALVDITGDGSSSGDESQSFESLPEIFKANLGAVSGDCHTFEMKETIFPNPGPVVELGTQVTQADLANPIQCNGRGAAGAGGAPATENPAVLPHPSSLPAAPVGTLPPTTLVTSFTANPTSTPTPTVVNNAPPAGGVFADLGKSSSRTTASYGTILALSSGVPQATAAPDAASGTGSTDSPASTGQPCTPGQSRCDSANTWSTCVAGGTWTSMGNMPAGLTCQGVGDIVRLSVLGKCDTLGATMCAGDVWATCGDAGVWIPMGSRSAGMKCVGGKTVGGVRRRM